MKVDIYESKINLNKLMQELNEFECWSGQQAYLIMNERTSEKLAFVTMSIVNPGWSLNEEIKDNLKNNKGYVSKFRGNTILIDNELADGEVEIK